MHLCRDFFSRHNEMGNYFRIYLISIATRHQKGIDWHIWLRKGGKWASSRAMIGIWVQPLRQKPSISQLPSPSPLTSMMYNFLITNTIVPKGIPVSFLIIFSVWNKTLSLIRKGVCCVIVFSINTHYRWWEHRGNNKASKKEDGILKNKCKSFLPSDYQSISYCAVT